MFLYKAEFQTENSAVFKQFKRAPVMNEIHLWLQMNVFKPLSDAEQFVILTDNLLQLWKVICGNYFVFRHSVCEVNGRNAAFTLQSDPGMCCFSWTKQCILHPGSPGFTHTGLKKRQNRIKE